MFGPAPVTSATFPSSDTSNDCPFCTLSHRSRAHRSQLFAYKYEARSFQWGGFRLWGGFGGLWCTRSSPKPGTSPIFWGLALAAGHSRITVRASTGGSLGLATAPGLANAVLVIRLPSGSGHTIYDTFDDEKRVI